MQKTVAIHTLGCKLNYSESSAITRQMEKDGFIKKDFDEMADVYVINTCSVTDNADKECRQLVRRIQRRSPGSMVVVTGCYAQLKPEEIASIDGVDLVLGASEKFNITHHLQELTKGDATKICSCDIEDVTDFHSSFSVNERTRSFLKVQDGCDYNCSFCTIPLARGRSRSDSMDNIIENVRQLSEQGIKEVVITGINLGDYLTPSLITSGEGVIAKIEEKIVAKKGAKNGRDFYELIKVLDDTEGIDRYRISSIEPNLLSNEIIEFVSLSKRFMPHFHIPLQSGSNRILAAMRRRYRKELYADRVRYIKELMPHCCIGADVIVGFPGETDEDFKETFDFLHSLDISYLHVFTYSERDNTHALTIKPVVPIGKRNERNKMLRNLSYQKMQYFTNRHSGEKRKVLFEGYNKNGMMEGYTDNYIKVTAPYTAEWVNNIVEWRI
jgi:threonylcarbamoyladenosine tRNA methylthiotransferase MtaB